MDAAALGLVPLGIAAGVMTTLAGQGGGLVLVLVLARFVGPHGALALTTPALFLGNLHRAILLRREVEGRTALLATLGTLPGAYIGGHLASLASPLALNVALVLVTALAVGKAKGWVRLSVPKAAFVPAGVVIGVLAGTSGGAGLLLGPLVHSTGLRGARFVGTVAVGAVALHLGRIVAYGHTGLLGARVLPAALVLAAGIFGGNLLADRLRPRLGERWTGRFELGALVGCTALAVVGLR